ncbi:MAG: arylsulfatase [Alteromonadaceae bacterium]|nr:arylsulfatase [Alteromonadaceae bacterium]
MKKIITMKNIMLSVGLTLVSLSTIAEQAKNPNILLIMVDDMGFSDIGAFGSEVKTPNLDKLAGEGMRFNQFRNTAKCFTTRASLMTGQYAQKVGMSDEGAQHFTYKNYVTFGDVLQTVGYKTLMVGKHHADDNPYDMGFDHYWGLRSGAANHFNPGYRRPGEAEPARKNTRRTFCFDAKCVQPYTPPNKDYYSTDEFTSWAIDMLGRHEKDNDEQPFFMYLSYTAPHDPIQAWPKDIAKYAGVYDEGYAPIAKARYERQLKSGLINAKTHPRSTPAHQSWDSLSAKEKKDQAKVMQVYAAMIDNLDQNIGRVLGHLKDTGELDNTLIIFLSDNGASAETIKYGEGEIGAIDRYISIGGHWANVSNVPFKAYKQNSFEGGVLSPFIVNWPGVIKGGGPVNETSAHLVDIMSTFIDITGATYPLMSHGEKVGALDGISLLPAFKNGSVKRDTPVYFQWRDGKAVVDGDWKLVVHKRREKEKGKALWAFATGDWELYDLSKDRTETNNLAASHPEKLAELTAKYETWWQEMAPQIVYPAKQ